MGLRRGSSKNFDYADESLEHKINRLLCDDWENATSIITIKNEFLDKPILPKAGTRGMSVVPNEPLSATALTIYISRRGKKLGYATAINFYSIRRRVATNLAESLGASATRYIMGHDSSTHTLERYYFDEIINKDVVAAAFGVPNDHSPSMATRLEISTTRLPEDAIADLLGASAYAFVHKMIRQDPSYPSRCCRAKGLPSEDPWLESTS